MNILLSDGLINQNLTGISKVYRKLESEQDNSAKILMPKIIIAL